MIFKTLLLLAFWGTTPLSPAQQPGAASPGKEGAEAGADSPSGIKRSYQAEIVRLDVSKGEIVLLHKASGYQVMARVTDKSTIKLHHYVHQDDLADGTAVHIYGKIDPDKKTVLSYICTVLGNPARGGVLKAVPASSTIEGRIERTQNANPPPRSWLSRDKKYVIGIRTDDGTSWALSYDVLTPSLEYDEPGTMTDLQPGRNAKVDIMVFPDHTVLQQAMVDVWTAGAEFVTGIRRCDPAGPSGVIAAQFQKKIDAVRRQYAGFAPKLAQLMPVQMKITPQLALKGESVKLEARVMATQSPNSKLTLYSDYFHTDMKQAKELTLEWKENGTDQGLKVYTASLDFPTAEVGQYLMEWNCDIGGGIPKYVRDYAVCDNDTTVCLVQNCCGAKPTSRFFVPMDTWDWGFLQLDTWTKADANAWANASAAARQSGIDPCFKLEHFAWGKAQLRLEPEELQKLQLKALKELAPLFGFHKDLITFWSYGLGNATVRLAREMGGFVITSLCTENDLDGLMEVNAFGKPETPYFMADDDFRKSGSGGTGGLVGIPQVLRNPYLAGYFGPQYNLEPTAYHTFGDCLPSNNSGANAEQDAHYNLQRYARHLDFMDGVFQMQHCQKSPFFLVMCMEMAGVMPGVTEGNQFVYDYMIKKAQTGKVVFAPTRGVAEFYQRHYTATPESVCYFPDYWAGVTADGKPDLVPDMMTIAGGELYARAFHGEILPDAEYDYIVPWNYPDIGNATIPRRLGDGNCFLMPGKHDKFAVTPKIVDIRPFHATRQDRIENGSLVVEVTVTATAACKNMALALWDIPREFKAGEKWHQAGEGCRFVPVLAPYTDNLNGFLVADVKLGKNVFSLKIDSAKRALRSQDFRIGKGVKGKTFVRNGEPEAYIWPSGPWPAKFCLTVPAGKNAMVRLPKGALVNWDAGVHDFGIPQGQGLFITGLTREEIIAGGTSKEPAKQ